MPPMMASIDLSWYALILPAIVGILQLIYQAGGGGFKAESHFHLIERASLYASISLITLTSCKPLPFSNYFKISLCFAILAFDAFLSAAVPSKLWWVPYLSCIRPLYELLRDLYLYCINMDLDHLWEVCDVMIGTAADEWNRRAQEIIQRFVPMNFGSPSSTAPANSNLEGIILE